jgi:hypothetical protein
MRPFSSPYRLLPSDVGGGRVMLARMVAAIWHFLRCPDCGWPCGMHPDCPNCAFDDEGREI